MKILRFEVNLFGENTYLMYDPDSREAAVIDPGMQRQEEKAAFDKAMLDNSLVLKYLLMTHLHVDHTFGVDHLRQKYPSAQLVAHRADEPLGASRTQQAQLFHLPVTLGPVNIDKYVAQGDTLTLGKEEIRVLEAPGHTPGHVLYYLPQSKVVFTGDVVFRGSIGRTDLPGGNHAQLLRSIHDKVVTLPADTVILPGHGPQTTVGEELRSNPFF